MSFYEGIRDNVATKLIRQYGCLHTFTRITKGAYDPASGSTTGDTSSNFTAYAVKESYSSFERNDSSIQVDDIKLTAEASGGFQVDDQVTIEGQEYKLVMVDPVKPVDIITHYELQARK